MYVIGPEPIFNKRIKNLRIFSGIYFCIDYLLNLLGTQK